MAKTYLEMKRKCDKQPRDAFNQMQVAFSYADVGVLLTLIESLFVLSRDDKDELPNLGNHLPNLGKCTCHTDRPLCPLHLTPYPAESK